MERQSVSWSAVRGIVLAAGALVLAQVSVPASAQPAWKPEKNVEIIVPAAPGGGTDRTARIVQRIFQEGRLVETPVVVVNRAGGGGGIGWTYASQHAGDAHYITMTQPALLTNFITGASKINHTNLTPIVQLANEYIGFSVKPDSPIATAQDLLERLRKDPQAIVFGVSNALGAPGHIALGLVARAAGIDVRKLKVVVFASGGESQTALLGGHIHVVPTTVANLVAPLQANRLRVLAVTAPKRMGGVFAQVPTWREHRIDAVVGNWRGIAGPPKLDRQQVAYWENVFSRLIRSDEWKKDLDANSAEPDYMNSAESKKFLDSELEDLRKVLGDLDLAKQ